MTYFSIVIPAFNRERLIARAINSVLRQDFSDFEIIVVDDGSADGTVDVVRGFTDQRIKLIPCSTNRGVGPARNTGIDAASGEWIICLDSDDELLPGALSTIHQRSIEVSQGVSRLEFMVEMDNGRRSPDPPLQNESRDYVQYLQWMERMYGRLSETLPVVRRSTCRTVRYSDDRTLEGPYHLAFMKQFCARSFGDVVRLYHQDAENQLTKPDVRRLMESARHQSLSTEWLLRDHGEALKKYAPRIYKRELGGLATLYFLCGNRRKGISYSLQALRHDFLSITNWLRLFVGLLGPKPIGWLKSVKTRFVNTLGRRPTLTN